MIKVPQFLSPDFLLRLFKALPGMEKPLRDLVREALKTSPESRSSCRHLVHHFEGDLTQSVSYTDLSVTDRRVEGRSLWTSCVDAPFDLSTSVRQARSAPRSCSLGVVEGMCETSRVLAVSDPKKAYQLAQEATKLASDLQQDQVTEEQRAELLALSHAALANSLRLQNRFPEAEEEFSKAEELLLQAGSGRLGLAPKILSLRASLETWKEDHARALATLTAAIQHEAIKHDPLLEARLLIQFSLVHIQLGTFQQAQQALHTAVSLLDPEENLKEWWCAMQHHLLLATELGQFDTAEAMLPKVFVFLEKLQSPTEPLLVRWIQARLARGRDHSEIAEAYYREVRSEFLAQGAPYRAASVTLELAQLLFEQGRLEEVKSYALETIAEFERQGVETELIGALALLEQAVLGQFLTAGILQDIRRRIERRTAAGSRNHPRSGDTTLS